MAFEYSVDIVLSAMIACCDPNGYSSGRNKDASLFLGAYQGSGRAWMISEGILCKMEQREEVLGLAVVTLRHKIRNHLNELTAQQQTELFERLMLYIKCATVRGMHQLMRHLSVATADLILRLRSSELIDACVDRLSTDAPTGLFQLLEVLPVEAATLKEDEQLVGKTENILRYLDWQQGRTDLDITCVHRGCLLICASWIRTHLISLEQLLNHVVVKNAFHIMQNQDLFHGQLCKEASECVVAILEHVSHGQKTQTLNVELSDQIYKYCYSIKFPAVQHEADQMNATAQMYTQMTKTYAGLSTVHPPSALLERGPVCFELLLQVANHCDIDIVISSMPMWHKLFDHLPFRFEPELSELYGPIVLRALDVFFRLCRLPNVPLTRGSHDFDTMVEFRGHVTDLLPSISVMNEMITLKAFTQQLMRTAFGNQCPWMDVEASLFFMTPLIPKLLLQHGQLLVDLMNYLPSLLDIDSIHPFISQQIIRLNTECHKCIDDRMQRHRFVEQLIHLCPQLKTNPTYRDILEMILKSCNILRSHRPKDLNAYEDDLQKLADHLGMKAQEPTS